jgi:hypothetical protein
MAFSDTMMGVANAFAGQRKPEVVQTYAAQIAKALGKPGTKRAVDPVAAHQYQGEGTNHCGPTTLAMVINMMLQAGGYDKNPVQFNNLQQAMQDGSMGFGLAAYRLNNMDFLQQLSIVEGNISGATLPWGLEQAFKDFNEGLVKAGGPNLGTAKFMEGGTKQHLLDNLSKGRQTAIMVVWPGHGGAHWMALAGYDQGKDQFTLLDPANSKKEVTKMAWKDLNEHWSRPIGLNNLPDISFLSGQKKELEALLTLNNVMITFGPK